jgi:hypothetical protein
MMHKAEKVVSKSRTYVAICVKTNFDGNYFRKFNLPVIDPWKDAWEIGILENNASIASWYFLNRVSSSACIDGVVTWEDFQDCEDEATVQAEIDAAVKAMS